MQPTPASATTATTAPSQTPTSTIAGLQLSEIDDDDHGDNDDDDDSSEPSPPALSTAPLASDLAPPKRLSSSESAHPQLQSKRQATDPALATPLTVNGTHDHEDPQDHHSPIKKPRPDAAPVRKMPRLYEHCNTRDLVVLISYAHGAHSVQRCHSP